MINIFQDFENSVTDKFNKFDEKLMIDFNLSFIKIN